MSDAQAFELGWPIENDAINRRRRPITDSCCDRSAAMREIPRRRALEFDAIDEFVRGVESLKRSG